MEVANRSLDTIEDQSRRDRYRLHLHVNTDQPADFRDPRGWRVPDDVAKYLTCDCAIVPTMLADGVPFSVGRTSRVTPERTRRIVIHRDHGCRVPGCNHTHHLEIHHIVHWSDDGPTETWNLIALCAHHHRLHHRGELHITGNADLPAGTPGAVTFTAADGTVLTASGAKPKPPGAPPPQPAKSYHGPAGQQLHLRWLEFRHPDDYPNHRQYDTDQPHHHN
ncbi:MAG: HNH endonuclease signature motif containing protein [Actinomycetota bacterium]